MQKARTEWGKRAMHAMIDKELSTADVAIGIGMSKVYVGSVIYGRTNSPKARKKISTYLNINDEACGGSS